jgi:hypothetical protein
LTADDSGGAEDTNEVDISLCGDKLAGANPEDILTIFEEYRIPFEDF